MSKQVRIRRGTSIQHATFTGADGEVTYDTTLKVLRLHDGATPGGKILRDPIVQNPGAFIHQVISTGSLLIQATDDDGNSLIVSVGISQLYGLVNCYSRLTLQAGLVRTPATLTYGASVALAFGGSSYQYLALTGNCSFSTSGLVSGSQLLVQILCDASLRTLVFPGGWKWVGSTVPPSIAAGKTALLELVSFSNADAFVVARWTVEP